MVKKVTSDDSLKPMLKSSGNNSLAEVADKVIFTPTPRQRQVKAKFWTRFQPGPFSSPDALTAVAVMEVTGESSLKEWWPKPGFREWFLNREEAREKLEYLFMKALSTAEDIMDDPQAHANAKVQMIKVIAELANKFPSKNLERYADDDINRMDEKQLKRYLESKGVTIKKETIIEIEGSDNDDAK